MKVNNFNKIGFKSNIYNKKSTSYMEKDDNK